MHGLIYRTIQLFITYTFGADTWIAVTRRAGLDFSEFEGMMRYERNHLPALLDAGSAELGRSHSDIAEDIGTFIVSHSGLEAVRRLLRFGGIDFIDFLHSLDDLDERVRLAVSDLDLPKLELRVHGAGHFTLLSEDTIPGYAFVMMGVLRAMADDYGALAFLEPAGRVNGRDALSIRLIEEEYTEGREFDLGAVGA